MLMDAFVAKLFKQKNNRRPHEYTQIFTENGFRKEHPAFGRIARRTHNLINNQGMEPEKALKKIRKERGESEVKLEPADRPGPIKIYGEIGTDIEKTAYDQLGTAGRESLWSSSHGAGRTSSRTQAKKNHDAEAYKKLIREKDILTIGVAKDETYQCYKDIDRIIDLQKGELVDVVAKMDLRVVVICGGRRSDDGGLMRVGMNY